MSGLERTALALLHRLAPETAHDVAHWALRAGLVRGSGPVTSPRLVTALAGMSLPNPVGLAAGFDKNARALKALSQAGFGFLEAGAVTPHAQPGNPKPRLFRLKEDRGIINRFGFNNDGMDALAPRLAQRPNTVPIGINLGANKDSQDRAQDYVTLVSALAHQVDFATVNISSPNTAALRDLQGKAALNALLARVTQARDAARPDLPIFVKIAPDLSDEALEDIAEIVLSQPIQAVIATNTTLARQGLRSASRDEAGGLSGAPLRDRARAVLARLYLRSEGRLPLIGVGGIATVEDAWTRLQAGATAVQLYSALIYEGLSLGARIAEGLEAKAAKLGLANLAELRGTAASRLV